MLKFSIYRVRGATKINAGYGYGSEGGRKHSRSEARRRTETTSVRGLVGEERVGSTLAGAWKKDWQRGRSVRVRYADYADIFA